MAIKRSEGARGPLAYSNARFMVRLMLLGSLEGNLGGAMRAAGGLFVNLTEAERAGARRDFFLGFLAGDLVGGGLHAIQSLDEAEHNDGDDEEVDAGADEGAEVDLGAGNHQAAGHF